MIRLEERRAYHQGNIDRLPELETAEREALETLKQTLSAYQEAARKVKVAKHSKFVLGLIEPDEEARYKEYCGNLKDMASREGDIRKKLNELTEKIDSGDLPEDEKQSLIEEERELLDELYVAESAREELKLKPEVRG